MRFLFFAAQYLPTVGGVERYTYNLAKTLIGMGHSATVATSALPGLPDEETGPEGIHIVRLPARLLMNGRFPVPKRGSTFRALAAELFAVPYDFAVINTRFYPLSLWAADQCKKRGIPAMVIDHSTSHLPLQNPVLALFGHWYEHLAMAFLKPRCVEICGVSQACNRWLRHFGVTPETVMYNCVDATGLRSMAAFGEARQRFALPQQAPVILYYGRLIKEKGVSLLLDAYRLVKQRLPEAILVMAGDGPELENLKATGGAGAIFPGSLPYDTGIGLIATADVFCLPTWYAEGFPTTVLEAAALETLIITTVVGGAELVEDGQTGLILNSLTPEALAPLLLEGLENTESRRQIEAQARQKVDDYFTWPKTAETLLEIAERTNEP